MVPTAEMRADSLTKLPTTTMLQDLIGFLSASGEKAEKPDVNTQKSHDKAEAAIG